MAFHESGGVCVGPLKVVQGNILGKLIATMGRLPSETPATQKQPEDVTVTSTFCEKTGGVHWKRIFPAGCLLQSRWYWDDKSKLAVDSFTYLGIPDFAAFGFVLEPVDAPHSHKSGFIGFKHITKKVWILGIPVPLSLALIADGVSIPHEDGGGWTVDVSVEHLLVGRVVSYVGEVRVIAP